MGPGRASPIRASGSARGAGGWLRGVREGLAARSEPHARAQSPARPSAHRQAAPYLSSVCATAEMMRGPPLAPSTARTWPSCSTMIGLMELNGFFPGLRFVGCRRVCLIVGGTMCGCACVCARVRTRTHTCPPAHSQAPQAGMNRLAALHMRRDGDGLGPCHTWTVSVQTPHTNTLQQAALPDKVAGRWREVIHVGLPRRRKVRHLVVKQDACEQGGAQKGASVKTAPGFSCSKHHACARPADARPCTSPSHASGAPPSHQHRPCPPVLGDRTLDPNPVLMVVVRLTAMPSPSTVHRCEVPWSGPCVPEVTFHKPPYTPMGSTPRSSIVALRRVQGGGVVASGAGRGPAGPAQ